MIEPCYRKKIQHAFSYMIIKFIHFSGKSIRQYYAGGRSKLILDFYAPCSTISFIDRPLNLQLYRQPLKFSHTRYDKKSCNFWISRALHTFLLTRWLTCPWGLSQLDVHFRFDNQVFLHIPRFFIFHNEGSKKML